MRAAIDGAGRLVVPKPLRDALGLRAGVVLDLEAIDGELRGVPRRPEVTLEQLPDGRAVLRAPEGTPPLTDGDVRDALDRERAPRG